MSFNPGKPVRESLAGNRNNRIWMLAREAHVKGTKWEAEREVWQHIENPVQDRVIDGVLELACREIEWSGWI